MQPMVSEPYRAAGYWRVRWTDPTTGERRQRSLGSVAKVTRTQARAMARVIEGGINQPVPEAVTLRAWSDRYIAAKTTARPGTIAEIERVADSLCAALGKNRVLGSITPEDAEGWRMGLEVRMRGSKFIAVNTVRKYIRQAKTLFTEAVKKRVLVTNPFDAECGAMVVVDPDWKPIGEKLPAFLDAIADDAVRTLAGLAGYAGLRRGEAQRLTWADVDWNERRLVVRTPEGRATTKHKYREVPLVPQLYAMLQRRYEACGDGSMPVGPQAASTVYLRLRTAAKAVGLPDYGKPLHALRAMRESEWLYNYPVLTVTAWLGHSPRVAQQHYAKPLAREFDAASRAPTLTPETVRNG